MEGKLEKLIKDDANFGDYEKSYNQQKFMDKVKNYAKKAGIKAIYLAFILYYSIPKLSLLDRSIVLCALGYFISPLDIIPDSIPIIGLMDDIYILKWACSRTFKSLKNAGKDDEEIKKLAKYKLYSIFGDFDEKILEDVL